MKKSHLACASLAVLALLPSTRLAQAPAGHLFTLHDLALIREVSEPHISPDGSWVAYTVTGIDLNEDKKTSDLWMTSWDGGRTVRLTWSGKNEESPRWSPDGHYLSFLSDRGNDEDINQLWLLDRGGGEAEKITEVPGGISDYAWSPDSRRLVLVIKDPDPEGPSAKDKADKKKRKPIIIDRFQFKEDETGYLDQRRQHLYLLNLASRKVELLTSGHFNEVLPAWSLDGAAIVFVTKRGEDFDRNNDFDLYTIEPRVGASAQQLITYEGADCDPLWESRPAWSPDGKFIAYIQGGPDKMIDYAVHQLAVIPAVGGSPRLMAPGLDRNVTKPLWSPDGRFLYFLVDEDRHVELAKVPAGGGPVERLLTGNIDVSDFSLGPDGRMAFLSSGPSEPFELFAFDRGKRRPLSRQNQELFSKLKLASVEEISFKSRDGTLINGFLVKPPDFHAGRKYPTLLRIHGGPVLQFSQEFRDDWQAFAAHGYVVVAANPRGSSGRGEVFAKAIYADWGNKDAQDVLAAVDYVVSRGIADPGRLGIGGWSYGGMLTNYTIAQDTRFKAAVSGASISNILAGYGTDEYTRDYEAELGTPWLNFDTWFRISFPFFHADRIVTPTLFMCGDKDFNVPLLNSEQMYQALRSLGRDTQLIIYPDQYHEIKKPSFVSDRLERSLAWYDKYLTAPAKEQHPSTSAMN
jgi:dipeptidyl aminopeptidase/acylaminoacyl peptidase